MKKPLNKNKRKSIKNKKMIMFLLFVITAAASCHPECHYACDDPVCIAICHSVCSPPVCQYQCPGDVSCSDSPPMCNIVCPADMCESEHCPACEIQCAEPSGPCVGCQNLCQAPVCSWSCEQPTDCPEPVCQLQCEEPACPYTPPVEEESVATSLLFSSHALYITLIVATLLLLAIG